MITGLQAFKGTHYFAIKKKMVTRLSFETSKNSLILDYTMQRVKSREAPYWTHRPNPIQTKKKGSLMINYVLGFANFFQRQIKGERYEWRDSPRGQKIKSSIWWTSTYWSPELFTMVTKLRRLSLALSHSDHICSKQS